MNTNYNNILEFIKNDEMTSLIKSMCDSSIEAYIVGGYVRDLALGKVSCDKDYVIKGMSAIDFAKKIANKIHGYFVLLDEEFDIARVVTHDKNNYLDFAGCFGTDIYTDLARRDFTINSIAISVTGSQHEIIDPNSGMVDLANKQIKAISESNIVDDPLRMLRAFRFASQLGFEIENQTLNYISMHKEMINNSAPERIHAELIKLFEGEDCSRNLTLMKDNGLLFEIFPELEPQIKIPPNLHHHLWLIDHSIETVKQIEQNIKTFPDWVLEHIYSEQANEIKYISLLKIAALLHDLGKPATWHIDEEGRHRFIKHDDVGAEISTELLKRLKFSKNANKYITKLIKYHIYPSQLIREDEPATEKAINRMFRRLEAETPDIMILAMADRLSARGIEISDDIIKKNTDGLRAFIEKYKKLKEHIDSIPKLISGHDVMKILDNPKGPIIGDVLKALREAQIAGEVTNKDEAVSFVERYK